MPVSRKRLPTVKSGDIVEIVFLDHVTMTGGLVEPIQCRVIGQIVNQDKQAYYLASWLTDENDVHNWDSHTILRSTIKKIRILEKKKLK